MELPLLVEAVNFVRKLLSLYLYRQLLSFYELLKTAEFSKGLRFAGAAIIPLGITGFLERIDIGIAMAVGVLLTSPSDVPGSLRRRVIGIGFSIVIAVLATVITGFALIDPILFVPVLILQIFHISMISVFGFRASLISFSGLLAVVLSMAQVASDGGIIVHALWIGVGGVWFLLFTLLLHYLFQRRETDALLAETFELTARYLEIKSQLLGPEHHQREEREKELFELQTTLNEKHEIIRELVINRRKNFGRSGMVRKRLLIFMELVDILELGMANPLNYPEMQKLFDDHERKIHLIQEWNKIMAAHLRAIGESLLHKTHHLDKTDLSEKREEALRYLKEYELSKGIDTEKDVLPVLINLFNFKDKQHQKVLSLDRLMKEWEGSEDLKLRLKDATRFLTTPDYNFKTLQDNLDFKSPIFRHSLRLTAVMVLGFAAGEFFSMQNAYWILLTTVVIMRPGYALTRDRFKQRLYGTLIGGAVAVVLVLLIRNPIFYGILAVIFLVLAHSMIQRNYKTAAAFITLNVVFVYSLLRSDVLEVIEYRVLDTVIGAGLAFLGTKFLWPTWEYYTIENFLKKSIEANANFLKEVESFYYSKATLPVSYRLARKKAFLAIGDLNAAFQRMAQEPKTNKVMLEKYFRLVSLNQEFLSATASLGTFIRSHPTTKPSEHFQNYMYNIQANLSALSNVEARIGVDGKNIKEATLFYENLYRELLDLHSGRDNEKENVKERLQEVQIIRDRLKWLLEITEGLKRIMLRNEKSHPFEVA
ncbi:FUSC family protein [Salinimicrobium sp. HB62]|uniref:FUSC family protein n=1 Tax=Salinimicrobium sp. HB62 TaxID=3077781 RepID=UPI002D79DA1C|nr:FUSC family membrane protein [Salinimicrobium sp. HB62]